MKNVIIFICLCTLGIVSLILFLPEPTAKIKNVEVIANTYTQSKIIKQEIKTIVFPVTITEIQSDSFYTTYKVLDSDGNFFMIKTQFLHENKYFIGQILNGLE